MAGTADIPRDPHRRPPIGGDNPLPGVNGSSISGIGRLLAVSTALGHEPERDRTTR